MVQVCEGHKTKNEMMTENIEMYKDMYMRIKRDMNRVITVSRSWRIVTSTTQTLEAERRQQAARSWC